jgi:hypothetical protein
MRTPLRVHDASCVAATARLFIISLKPPGIYLTMRNDFLNFIINTVIFYNIDNDINLNIVIEAGIPLAGTWVLCCTGILMNNADSSIQLVMFNYSILFGAL